MNESNNLVSIIIPCYNASDYIERCLASLENQTCKNFEAIIVDDCSNDDTVEKIAALENKLDYRIQVIKNNKNMGPSLSRQKGVSASSGDYICFCDSDDWFDNVFVEKMLSSLLNADADIVFCGYKVVDKNSKTEYRKLQFDSQPITKEDSLVVDCDSLCMSLMKRSIIENIEMPDIRNGEDTALIPILIQNSNRVYLVPDCLYNYYRRTGSASQQSNISVVYSLEESFAFIKKHLLTSYPNEVEYLGVRNYLYPCLITLFSISHNRKEGSRLLREFEFSFPKWRKNEYIKKMPFYKRLVLLLLRMKAFLLIRLVALLRLKKTS